jgi:N4-gp56 family major capsid protein
VEAIMAVTNFGALAPDQIKVWQRDVLHEMREKSYILRTLSGKGSNFPIQLVTDLKKTLGGGLKCIMTLVADLVEDGGVGSVGGKREGVEEQMKSYHKELIIDEIFHSVRNEGKLADQNTVVDFRKEAKDKLSTWLADRCDQLAFLTLSGIGYTFNLDGSLRASDTFSKLNFASYVTSPTAKRHRRWDGTAGALVAADTTAITTSDVPSYKMLTAMKAYAKAHKIKPLMAGGKEYYIVLMQAMSLMALKNDADYKNAVIQGGVRGDENPFFTGGIVTVDGLILQEHSLVYSTNSAATRWGAGGDVNGSRTLLLGAQALGFADLGAPEWVEKGFEYDSQQGIYTSKIFGLVKPDFYSTWDKSVEDFGVLAVDHYMAEY